MTSVYRRGASPSASRSRVWSSCWWWLRLFWRYWLRDDIRLSRRRVHRSTADLTRTQRIVTAVKFRRNLDILVKTRWFEWKKKKERNEKLQPHGSWSNEQSINRLINIEREILSIYVGSTLVSMHRGVENLGGLHVILLNCRRYCCFFERIAQNLMGSNTWSNVMD